MGTNTRTLRDTKAEAEIDKVARCVVEAVKLARSYLQADHTNIWKCIDYTTEMIVLQHLTTQEVNKVWKKAFDIDNDNGENNNMVSVCSRLAIVGMFFTYKTSKHKDMYTKWKNKCSVHAMYYKVKDLEKKAIKRITEKEVMTKESLDKDIEDGVANAEVYSENLVKPGKIKSNKNNEPRSFNKTESYSLDRELKDNMRKLIRGEPIVFFRMVVGFAEVGLLTEDWKQLAFQEIEKLV